MCGSCHVSYKLPTLQYNVNIFALNSQLSFWGVKKWMVLTSPTYLPFPMLFISLCWSEFPSVSFFFCLKNSSSISPSDELWSLLSESVFTSPLFGRIYPLYAELRVDSFFFWFLTTLRYCFWWEVSHHSYYCFPLLLFSSSF